VEIYRTVNAVGMVSISGNYHSVGQQFAGRRITLRLEATLGHVIIDGMLIRTIPLTLTRPNAPASLDLPRSWTSGPPGYSARCPAAVASKSSANASKSDSATPARSSLSKSTKPPCASTTSKTN
jgi:hypothetical protein